MVKTKAQVLHTVKTCLGMFYILLTPIVPPQGCASAPQNCLLVSTVPSPISVVNAIFHWHSERKASPKNPQTKPERYSTYALCKTSEVPV